MKLSISNIGWSGADNSCVYGIMSSYGFSGLEIAPTKIFPESPYEKLDSARVWREELQRKYGFVVSSIQSIWYGHSETIFGSKEERKILFDYTKKAIDFAEAIGCSNLVFGCPKNRSITDSEDVNVAIDFFKKLGTYAYMHHTVIAMEANPLIYNTNFLNTTEEAMKFVEQVDSKGFLLNLDTGTMIENFENISIFRGKGHLINHVHISEPALKPLQKRKLYMELAEMLRTMDYQKFISIEVGRQDHIQRLSEMMEYVKEIFG